MVAAAAAVVAVDFVGDADGDDGRLVAALSCSVVVVGVGDAGAAGDVVVTVDSSGS